MAVEMKLVNDTLDKLIEQIEDARTAAKNGDTTEAYRRMVAVGMKIVAAAMVGMPDEMVGETITQILKMAFGAENVQTFHGSVPEQRHPLEGHA